MKKLLFAAVFMSVFACFNRANAQLQISLNLNIGTQPDWGPTGYDHAEYYYLPDIDCYYYVPGKQFIYRNGSQWVWRTSLPPQYSNYDLYKSYKVVVNKPKPYLNDADYRNRYSSYKGRHDQPIIRDSHDSKYRNRNNNDNHQPAAKPAPERAGNGRPATRPAPQPQRSANRPAPQPQRPANEHRPAADNHSAPHKPAPAAHQPQQKERDKDHH